MKVSELTKQLNIKRVDLDNLVADLGIRITGPSQKLDEETIGKIRGKLESKSSGQPLSEEIKNQAKKVQEAAASANEEEDDRPVLRLKHGATVKEFADALNISHSDMIKKLIMLGEMLTINQPVSDEAISLIADENGYRIEIDSAGEEDEEVLERGTPVPRAPVVTVMGHVDHGKTSLLDAIRRTDVVTGEAGGITQHIGAYQVKHGDYQLTFLDTPGHEAFTAMRARGAQATDIAVLVVAADDGVKAQTKEALDHAKAANVPVLVAVNKIDKPEANPDKVKKELSELGLVPEDWGGDTVMVEVSAKTEEGLNNLLDMIHLVAEMMEIKAPEDVSARGIVIEGKLDKSRGPVITALVQRGLLKVGQTLVAGTAMGRVRAMFDDKGKSIRVAHPAQPVEVLGLASLPQAGDIVKVVADEKTARQMIADREAGTAERGFVTAAEAMQRLQAKKSEELRVVIKADVGGSLEALKDALDKLTTEEVRVSVLHSGVGAISETDVMLASASEAFIIAFQVRPEPKAKEMAERENVEIRTHRVLYQVVDDVRAAALGLLKPQIEEEEMGRVEVREVFKVPKIGMVAGCYVLEGEVNRGALVRVVRDGVVIHEGKLESLRRFKDDVASVKTGFECGITVENYRDIKEKDILEIYKLIEVPRTELSAS